MPAKKPRALGDIFSSTSKAPTKPVGQAVTAADGFTEDAVVKTTLFLTQDQLDYLDDQTREIKRGSKVTLKRSAIVRALVDGLRLENVSLGACESEKGLADAVRKRMPLKGGRI